MNAQNKTETENEPLISPSLLNGGLALLPCPFCGKPIHDNAGLGSNALINKLRSYNRTSGYSHVMRQAADEIERLQLDSKLCKQILTGFIDHGGIPNWVLDLTPNVELRGAPK